MDWGLVSIPLAIILFIVTILLTLKVTKRKKPVWAYKTTKIIGLGSNAPPELKLTFSDRPVNEVYQTSFILFNKGTEAVRKVDMTEQVTIHFKGAKILREPTIRAKSKEAIQFSAKQVIKDRDSAIEVGFLYLDHNDGAVVEVLHTKSQKIACTGNIIGAREIVNIGNFEPSRPQFLRSRLFTSILPILMIGLLLAVIALTKGLDYLVAEFFAEKASIALFIVILIVFAVMLSFATYEYTRYMKFPRWSRNIPLEGAPTEELIKAYCVKCRAKVLIANPHFISMKNGRQAIQGVCSRCGTKVFRIP